MLIVFRIAEKDYRGTSALEIVRKLESDAADYPSRGGAIREFLSWSLNRLGNQISPRDTDLSERIEEEALALNYLYLRDEYGAGKLIITGQNSNGLG